MLKNVFSRWTFFFMWPILGNASDERLEMKVNEISTDYPSAIWHDFTPYISGNPRECIGCQGGLYKKYHFSSYDDFGNATYTFSLHWLLFSGRPFSNIFTETAPDLTRNGSLLSNGTNQTASTNIASQNLIYLSEINLPNPPSQDNVKTIPLGSWNFTDISYLVQYSYGVSFAPRTDAISTMLYDTSNAFSPWLFFYGGSDWSNGTPLSFLSDFFGFDYSRYTWVGLSASESTHWGPISFAEGHAVSSDFAIWCFGTSHAYEPNLYAISTAGIFENYIVDFFVFNVNATTRPSQRFGNSLSLIQDMRPNVQQILEPYQMLYSYGGVWDGGVYPDVFNQKADLYRIDITGLIDTTQATGSYGYPVIPRSWQKIRWDNAPLASFHKVVMLSGTVGALIHGDDWPADVWIINFSTHTAGPSKSQGHPWPAKTWKRQRFAVSAMMIDGFFKNAFGNNIILYGGSSYSSKSDSEFWPLSDKPVSPWIAARLELLKTRENSPSDDSYIDNFLNAYNYNQSMIATYTVLVILFVLLLINFIVLAKRLRMQDIVQKQISTRTGKGLIKLEPAKLFGNKKEGYQPIQ